MIQPLNLASAAADTTGALATTGDVRHQGPGDGVDYGALSATTRQLAQRDALIQEALNKVIAQINNAEQAVVLPAVRITLPPATSEVVIDYRIPPGFESRILDAAVASNPSGFGLLTISYNADTAGGIAFGGSGGSALVNTTSEATGGTNFYPSGEFIVTVANESSQTVDVSASITLSLRPVGSPDGSLLTAGAVGPAGTKGDTGQTGGQGGKGDKGDAGTPGVAWRGPWNSVTSYNVNDAVSSGTLVAGPFNPVVTTNGNPNITVSSTAGVLPGMPVVDLLGAIPVGTVVSVVTSGTGITLSNNCTLNTTLDTVSVTNPPSAWIATSTGSGNEPAVGSGQWQLLAAAGAQGIMGGTGGTGATGATGNTGATGVGIQGEPGPLGLIPQGAWSSTGTYAATSVVSVSYSTGSGVLTTAYISNGSNINTYPPSNSGPDGAWTVFMQPAISPIYYAAYPSGTFTRVSGSQWGSGSYACPANGGPMAFKESVAISYTTGQSNLNASFLLQFSGSATITLPQVVPGGAARNWQASEVAAVVALNSGSHVLQSTASATSIGIWADPAVGQQSVSVLITGNQPFTL